MRYEVMECRRLVNTKTGQTASIYGSAPYYTDEDKLNWEMRTVGWTVMNPYTGEIGACRKPFETRKEAEEFAEKFKPCRYGISD